MSWRREGRDWISKDISRIGGAHIFRKGFRAPRGIRRPAEEELMTPELFYQQETRNRRSSENKVDESDTGSAYWLRYRGKRR